MTNYDSYIAKFMTYFKTWIFDAKHVVNFWFKGEVKSLFSEEHHITTYINQRTPHICGILIAGRQEMFYLMTHSTHIIYGYMASDI